MTNVLLFVIYAIIGLIFMMKISLKHYPSRLINTSKPKLRSLKMFLMNAWIPLVTSS